METLLLRSAVDGHYLATTRDPKQHVLRMNRIFSIAVSILISFLSDLSAQSPDDISTKRQHFQLVRGDQSAKLLPVDPTTPIGEGETRVSCSEIEFYIKYNKPRTRLVDARIEYFDSWLEEERIEIEHGPDGLQLKGAGLVRRHFKTAEAEEKAAERSRLRAAEVKGYSIDRGMIESEKEHRKMVLQQLRRTFITGQSQISE